MLNLFRQSWFVVSRAIILPRAWVTSQNEPVPYEGLGTLLWSPA